MKKTIFALILLFIFPLFCNAESYFDDQNGMLVCRYTVSEADWSGVDGQDIATLYLHNGVYHFKFRGIDATLSDTLSRAYGSYDGQSYEAEVYFETESMREALYSQGHCPQKLDIDTGDLYGTPHIIDALLFYDNDGDPSGWPIIGGAIDFFQDMNTYLIAMTYKTFFNTAFFMEVDNNNYNVINENLALASTLTSSGQTICVVEPGVWDIINEFLTSYNNNRTSQSARYIFAYHNANDITRNIVDYYGPTSTCYQGVSSEIQSKIDVAYSLSNSLVEYNTSIENSEGSGEPVDLSTCQGIIGDVTDHKSFAYHLHIVFKILKFLVPVLIIVMSTIDYIKALTTAETDSLKTINKKTVIRLIFALLFYYIPVFIEVLLKLFHIYGDCGIK